MAENGVVRADGRRGNLIRPLYAEQGLLHRADGSARFVQGNTSVLAAVYGPGTAKYARHDRPNKAVIEVDWTTDCFQSNTSDRSANSEREAFVRDTLEQAVVVAHYPRTVILVAIQVLSDDGAVLSTAINAAGLALMSAGVDLLALPLSMTCWLYAAPKHTSLADGFSNFGPPILTSSSAASSNAAGGNFGAAAAAAAAGSSSGSSGGEEGGSSVGVEIMLDPTGTEEAAAVATAVIAVLSTGNGILSAKVKGELTPQELFACAEAATRGCKGVESFIRMSCERWVRQDAVTKGGE